MQKHYELKVQCIGKNMAREAKILNRIIKHILFFNLCSHLPRKRCMCWNSTLVHSLAGKHLDCLSWQHVEQLRSNCQVDLRVQEAADHPTSAGPSWTPGSRSRFEVQAGCIASLDDLDGCAAP